MLVGARLVVVDEGLLSETAPYLGSGLPCSKAGDDLRG